MSYVKSAVRDVASSIAGDDVDKLKELIVETVNKSRPVARKLEHDTMGRLRASLQIFKGPRMLGFQYLRDNTIEALNVELNFLQFLPVAVPLMNQLQRELRRYKQLADEFQYEDGWAFWRSYYNSLPYWYKVAAEVALVMTSSASVERVFSLLADSMTSSRGHSQITKRRLLELLITRDLGITFSTRDVQF